MALVKKRCQQSTHCMAYMYILYEVCTLWYAEGVCNMMSLASFLSRSAVETSEHVGLATSECRNYYGVLRLAERIARSYLQFMSCDDIS